MAVPLAGSLLTWLGSLPPRHNDSPFIGWLFLPNGFWFAWPCCISKALVGTGTIPPLLPSVYLSCSYLSSILPV
jgi:hypothetical protein